MGVRVLPMRQSYRIIPVYTADVSGVCSALYELGGMTVMHDPSGCNSTYNTHDEIRWYDQDSLIFISGLTEIDAVMGNDRKFINDITYTASELHPAFIGDGHGYSGNCSISAGTAEGTGKAWREAIPDISCSF